jgi:hypothetical protein
MQLYIQKWGRRVGFDLNAQPSDEALTHAIIQVLLLTEVQVDCKVQVHQCCIHRGLMSTMQIRDSSQEC